MAAVFWLLALCCCGVHGVDFDKFTGSFCEGDLQVSNVPGVDCGDPVDFSSALSEEPTITWSGADSSKKYLILMVDPDAPNADTPTARSWLHWIKTGVPGSDLVNGGNGGSDYVAYNGPTPPFGTGYHRYITAVYEQPEGLSLKGDYSSRGRFDVPKFMSTEGLGEPGAIFMYQTRRE